MTRPPPPTFTTPSFTLARDVVIGSAMVKGISGGQAKRTNIGIGLITNPRVLFLDEPTSGLDSYTSNEVMTVVKALVADGTTICATIVSGASSVSVLSGSASRTLRHTPWSLLMRRCAAPFVCARRSTRPRRTASTSLTACSCSCAAKSSTLAPSVSPPSLSP